MTKKYQPNLDDLASFYKAVEDVKPLRQKKVRLSPSQPKFIKPSQSPQQSISLSEKLDITEVKSEDFISFKQSGISNKTLRKLRKGQYNVEARLDLHGMSQEEAKTTVENFLHQCLYEGKRVVLIIHGKGHHSQMPVLKNKINHWLRELDVVLAFCSANPSHGSRGAIYILLKRTTEENLFE